MSAITLDNVSKRYGDVHALRPLSVEFPAGKLSTIFGKSGSGKTTLLSVIAGLLKPTTGAIWYQDKDIATRSPRTNARPCAGPTSGWCSKTTTSLTNSQC